MPTIEELLDFLASQGIPDEWQPAETIESGGGTIPKTSSKGLVRSATNEIIELGKFARIMAQYAMRDQAAARAASTLGLSALYLAKGAYERADQIQTRMLRTGRIYIANKHVGNGLNVTPGNGRSVNIAAGTAFHGGFQRYYPERPNAVAVPTNPGATAKTYVLYLDNNGSPYLLEGSTPPEGGLGLARISVPAGDTGAAFGGSITDIRAVASPTTWTPRLISTTIPLAPPMPDTEYHVYLFVESATDLQGVGAWVSGKALNAFTIRYQGMADDVVLRYLVVRLSAQV